MYISDVWEWKFSWLWGNEIMYCCFITLQIWERLRVPENRYAGSLIFGERERPEVKRTLGRPRHRRKNIKMDV